MPNLLDWGLTAPDPEPVSEPAVTANLVTTQGRGPRTGRTNPGRRQGEHGTGPRTYTPADVSAVIAALKGTTALAPISVANLATATGLNGRTVRSILSERDGLDFLVGAAPTGELFDASGAVSVAEGDGFTDKLESQIKRMAERVRRRTAYRHAVIIRDTTEALESVR
jgi:hypothetical protein